MLAAALSTRLFLASLARALGCGRWRPLKSRQAQRFEMLFPCGSPKSRLCSSKRAMEEVSSQGSWEKMSWEPEEEAAAKLQDALKEAAQKGVPQIFLRESRKKLERLEAEESEKIAKSHSSKKLLPDLFHHWKVTTVTTSDPSWQLDSRGHWLSRRSLRTCLRSAFSSWRESTRTDVGRLTLRLEDALRDQKELEDELKASKSKQLFGHIVALSFFLIMALKDRANRAKTSKIEEGLEQLGNGLESDSPTAYGPFHTSAGSKTTSFVERTEHGCETGSVSHELPEDDS